MVLYDDNYWLQVGAPAYAKWVTWLLVRGDERQSVQEGVTAQGTGQTIQDDEVACRG